MVIKYDVVKNEKKNMKNNIKKVKEKNWNT